MLQQPPRDTRSDSLCPYTTLFRSQLEVDLVRVLVGVTDEVGGDAGLGVLLEGDVVVAAPAIGGLERGGERKVLGEDQVEEECTELAGVELLLARADRGLVDLDRRLLVGRSEEHTSELQSLMRISYAVFCLKKKNKLHIHPT